MLEPEKLHFNFIDLLGAPRRALKPKKIWTHLAGLVIGYPIYAFLTYLALWVEGNTPATTWDQFGIYPFFSLHGGPLSSPAAWVIYAIGLAFWLVVTLIAATAVARITYKELKGNPFYTASFAATFARRHQRTVFTSPVTVILIILFFLVMAVVMALIGKIPFFGEAVFVGLYPLYFAGAVFALYTAAVLIVLIWYLPAIIALWEDDAMGSTFQAYAITWNQAWRVVVYSALIVVLAAVGTIIYGWVITAGYHFINWVFGAPWLMGDKLAPVLAWAERIVFSGYCSFFCFIPGQGAPLSSLTAGVDLAAVSGWEALLGSVLAIIMLLIYSSALAYGLAVISVGQSLSFLIYKLKTDDENLLERMDEEELEEREEEDQRESTIQEESGVEGPPGDEENRSAAAS